MNRPRALEILGVAPGASREEIRAARHRMLLGTHPDKHGGDAAAFREAKEAGDKALLGAKPKRRAGRPKKRKRGFEARPEVERMARRRENNMMSMRRQRDGVAAERALDARERAAASSASASSASASSSLAAPRAPLPPPRAPSMREVTPSLSPGTWDTRGTRVPPGANGTPERLRPQARREAVTTWKGGLTVAQWSAVVWRRIQARKPIPSVHFFGNPTFYNEEHEMRGGKVIEHAEWCESEGNLHCWTEELTQPTWIEDRTVGRFELTPEEQSFFFVGTVGF